jgi:hypothetical protein
VENDVILAGIMQQLPKVKDNVEIRHDTKVKKYLLANTGVNMGAEGQGHLASVELEDGSVLSTNLLVSFHTPQYFLNCIPIHSYTGIL